MTKDQATKLINTCGKAWVTRDPDLIVSIFTEDATYHDPHEPLNTGRDAIRSYWMSKVVGGQSDIIFDLKNVWVDGETVIAEWYAEFTDTKKNRRFKIKEIGVFTIKDGKINSLREYYVSEYTQL